MATRRNVVNRSGGGPKTRGFDSDEHQIVESPDQNTEEEESTDKDTRLTLMEEVLLLGLKDREVSVTQRFSCLSNVNTLSIDV